MRSALQDSDNDDELRAIIADCSADDPAFELMRETYANGARERRANAKSEEEAEYYSSKIKDLLGLLGGVDNFYITHIRAICSGDNLPIGAARQALEQAKDQYANSPDAAQYLANAVVGLLQRIQWPEGGDELYDRMVDTREGSSLTWFDSAVVDLVREFYPRTTWGTAWAHDNPDPMGIWEQWLSVAGQPPSERLTLLAKVLWIKGGVAERWRNKYKTSKQNERLALNLLSGQPEQPSTHFAMPADNTAVRTLRTLSGSTEMLSKAEHSDKIVRITFKVIDDHKPAQLVIPFNGHQSLYAAIRDQYGSQAVDVFVMLVYFFEQSQACGDERFSWYPQVHHDVMSAVSAGVVDSKATRSRVMDTLEALSRVRLSVEFEGHVVDGPMINVTWHRDKPRANGKEGQRRSARISIHEALTQGIRTRKGAPGTLWWTYPLAALGCKESSYLSVFAAAAGQWFRLGHGKPRTLKVRSVMEASGIHPRTDRTIDRQALRDAHELLDAAASRQVIGSWSGDIENYESTVCIEPSTLAVAVYNRKAKLTKKWRPSYISELRDFTNNFKSTADAARSLGLKPKALRDALKKRDSAPIPPSIYRALWAMNSSLQKVTIRSDEPPESDD